jgi:nitronate monooxygenase
MTLSTAFTTMFSLRHPIALAPLGGTAGGALTAAVSNGGGLGLLGGGSGDLDWLDRELPIVAEGTSLPLGGRFPELGGRPRHRRACAAVPAPGRDAVLR